MSMFKKVLITLVLFTIQLFSCAGGWNEMYVKDENYNFTSPSMIGLNQNNSLYFLSNDYGAHADRLQYFEKVKKSENIKAWQSYLGGSVSSKEIENIFYSNLSVSQSYKKYATKINKPQLASYIDFLDKQMPFVTQDYNPSWEPKPPLPKNYQTVLSAGISLFNNSNDKFLKERYMFLVMRLYHYGGDYRKALDFYSKNKSYIQKGSVVDEWTKALKAGALQNLGFLNEANMLYADIFKNNKTNAYLGYYDFKVTSDSQWNALLGMAKTNDEKAELYFLRAMNWENSHLMELENIASVAPESVWFERLSFMVMQDLQNQRYSIMQSSTERRYSYDNDPKSYNEQMVYYKKILQSLKNPSFFSQYALLYLDVLSYKNLDSSKMSKLKSVAGNNATYVSLLEYLDKLNKTKSIDEVDSLTPSLKSLLASLPKEQQVSLVRYSVLQLSTLYPKDSVNRLVTMEYATNKYFGSYNVGYLLNEADADEFEQYMNLKNRTFLHKEVFLKMVDEKKDESFANFMAGTLFIQKNNFSKALSYLNKTNLDDTVISDYNPFNATISGNNRTGKQVSYDQAKFATTMLELQNKIKANTANATDYYLYATGLYNKSWFGSFPKSSVYNRSTYLEVTKRKTEDLDLAQKYYMKSLSSAKDNEMKAKISYQLLKIDFARMMLKNAGSKNEIWNPAFDDMEDLRKLVNVNPSFRQNLKDYKQSYSNTSYGREAIRSCASFRSFL
jgi:hypothetical protein